MDSILEVNNLETQVLTAGGVIKAVSDVSFAIQQGETLGLVGESGCGKSMTALSILRLIRFPGVIVGGQILYYLGNGQRSAGHGQDARGQAGRSEARSGLNLLSLPEPEMRSIRGAHIAMIFQEPMTALNPVLTIGTQIMEVVRAHERVSSGTAESRALETLRAVSMPLPERRMREYPHQLSGGLRQRAMIAMALVTRPRLLIADEPTTALDVTIQAQILELLARLKEEFGLSLLFISHDLGVIAKVADRVAVMYAGRIVEISRTRELFSTPLHPYTEALLRAVPRLRPGRQKRLEPIPGSVPDLRFLPPGCAFQPRCPVQMGDRCSRAAVKLIEVAPQRQVRCVKYE